MQCPLGHWRCMRELTVDAIVAHVTQMTAERR
jgi:hypothetical protein